MSKKEEKVWQFLLANRKADYAEVAEACGVDIDFVKRLVGRIGSDNRIVTGKPFPLSYSYLYSIAL